MQANSGDPDQTPRFAASGLALHYLPMSHKKVATCMLIWVNQSFSHNHIHTTIADSFGSLFAEPVYIIDFNSVDPDQLAFLTTYQCIVRPKSLHLNWLDNWARNHNASLKLR